MPELDATELRASLPAFDFHTESPATEDIRAYFEFYGLDFTDIKSVDHYFGYITVAEYNIAVHYYSQPSSNGTVFVLHGFYDHAGIYTHPVRHFLERGYDVVVYDQPGHGLSSGERASISDFADYQKILNACMEMFTNISPKPWLLLGQSMGGAIAMTHLLEDRNSPFQKTILFAPLVYPTGWFVGRWIHALAKMFIKEQKRIFVNNSHDDEFLFFLREDDFLQPVAFPLQWATAMKHWIKKFETLGESEVECLVFQGTDDRTVAWRHNMNVVQSRFPNNRIHYLPSARHQLVNESETFRREMFSAIDDFLDNNKS